MTEPTDTAVADDYAAYQAWKAKQSAEAEPQPLSNDDVIKQLQQQMAEQQKKIDALNAERGIPSDPVAAKLQALSAHLDAQANANPLHAESYAPVQKYVAKLVKAKEDGSDPTDKQALKVRTLVETLAEKHSGHELAYTRDLARELHTDTLDDDDDDDSPKPTTRYAYPGLAER